MDEIFWDGYRLYIGGRLKIQIFTARDFTGKYIVSVLEAQHSTIYFDSKEDAVNSVLEAYQIKV